MSKTVDIIDMTGPNKKRSKARAEMLAGILVTAIEHNGYGQFIEHSSEIKDDNPDGAWAVLEDPNEEKTFKVGIGTIARGLSIIRRAFYATFDNGTYLVNPDTWERLYYGGENRDDLVTFDRSNGDDGDCDVIGALAALECGLYDRVVYA